MCVENEAELIVLGKAFVDAYMKRTDIPRAEIEDELYHISDGILCLLGTPAGWNVLGSYMPTRTDQRDYCFEPTIH